MELQQVYNTTREQQENSKRYDKRYSKFIRYSLLILFINTVIHEITLQKIAMTSSLFFFMNRKTKNIKPVSSLGPVLAPRGGYHSPPRRGLKTFEYNSLKMETTKKQRQDTRLIVHLFSELRDCKLTEGQQALVSGMKRWFRLCGGHLYNY